MLPLETVALHFLRFLKGDVEVADVLNMLENSHLFEMYDYCFICICYALVWPSPLMTHL